MSDPKEHFGPEPTGDSRERTLSDLPEALADVQQRMQQLRPRQPQLDLAMLEQLAIASRPSPPRDSAGFSRLQLALAIAASWLCGVVFGAALLFGIRYQSLDGPQLDPLAVLDDHAAVHAHVDQTASVDQTAGDVAVGGGTVADNQAPTIVSDSANPAALVEREWRLPKDNKPAQDDAIVTTIIGGVPSHHFAANEPRWEGPLSVNSLRLSPSQQFLVGSQKRPPYPPDEPTPSNRPSGPADAAAAAPDPAYAPGPDTFIPTVPKSRQQWLDDLLAIPPTDVL